MQDLKGKKLQSNDRHIIALAKASGARLLYTGDGKLLRKDFDNKAYIDNPTGKIYPKGKKAKELKKWLEQNKWLCSTKV